MVTEEVMNLLLKRHFDDGIATLGTLFLDGVQQCYTLEPPWKDNQRMVSCIPPGTYPLVLQYSPRFTPKYGHKLVLVNNVPDRDNILIHIGNFPKDTDGCIMVGLVERTSPEPMVLSSSQAYASLYPKLSAAILAGDTFLTVEPVAPVDPAASVPSPNPDGV
jgi:hypothetical protein